MTDPRIGSWVARFRLFGDAKDYVTAMDGQIGERLTKPHLVESVIAGREITRCGRQLADRKGTIVAVVLPTDPCKACS